MKIAPQKSVMHGHASFSQLRTLRTYRLKKLPRFPLDLQLKLPTLYFPVLTRGIFVFSLTLFSLSLSLLYISPTGNSKCPKLHQGSPLATKTEVLSNQIKERYPSKIFLIGTPPAIIFLLFQSYADSIAFHYWNYLKSIEQLRGCCIVR